MSARHPTTLADKIGQMIAVGFDGLTAPDYILNWLREGRVGGVILFARNIDTPAQVAALCDSLHAAANYPLLIAIDQEGGMVARLRDGFSESPGALALASIPNDAEATTEAVSAVLGREMAALGINWTYAPAIDITYTPDNPTVATRSFGSDPEQVGVLGAAAVRGFQSSGVAACGKHFPGLGATAIDTHHALPTLNTPAHHLRTVDLVPYRAAMGAGVASVMTTHTIYSALDPDHPATLSKIVLPRLLREELGFDGVVATDCMEMAAIDDHYGIAEAVVRAAHATVDVMLISHTPDKQAAAYDALVAAVERGDLPMTVIDTANRRIANLKAAFPYRGTDLTAIRTDDNQHIVKDAARAAVSLIRGQTDTLPIDPAHTLLVEFTPDVDSPVQDVDVLNDGLIPLVKTHFPNLKAIALPPYPTDEQVAMVNVDVVTVVVLATRSAHLKPAQADAVRQLAQRSQRVLLVALRNPYDAGILVDAPALATCGDSLPSLHAAADALAGVYTPSGRLTVEV